MKIWMLLISTALLAAPLWAQNANDDILPPAPPWSGKSRELALPPDHAWATPFEKEGLAVSPNYRDTIAWLDKLEKEAPELTRIEIGRTLQNRALVVYIASKEGAASAESLKANGKPTLFAHAGIHAGEIDGKDAGMMLLRDLTVTGKKAHLLDHANFLFLPILNADGHEHASPHGRINQRGPRVMGWRTNGRNLNLNRDFAKLETAALKALIPFLNHWDPDLYFDIHVTDGIDYQYDITFGFTGTQGYSPAASGWLAQVLTPAVNKHLSAMDHVPGPLIFARDKLDLGKGILAWGPSPRFSNGYGDVRHLPTVLVENHSLKPYDQRVLGTYLLLESTLEILGRQGRELREATQADRARRPREIALQFGPSDSPPPTMTFLGIEKKTHTSELTGGTYNQWLGKPITLEVPVIAFEKPGQVVTRPDFYVVPADWTEIIEKLRLHGVTMEILKSRRTLEVVQYRFKDPKLETKPFEGRIRLTAKHETEKASVSYPPGSAIVRTDQPLGELIVLLLEPDAPDSFWQWGYFLEILQATEYFEAYVLEPLAAKMLVADPELKRLFEEKKEADPAFRADARAQLDFFYQRSPYADDHWMLYPIGKSPR